MNPELAALLILAAALLWLRHQWHLRRFPDRLTCHHCHGTGTTTASDLLGRTVKAPAPAATAAPGPPADEPTDDRRSPDTTDR